MILIVKVYAVALLIVLTLVGIMLITHVLGTAGIGEGTPWTITKKERQQRARRRRNHHIAEWNTHREYNHQAWMVRRDG